MIVPYTTNSGGKDAASNEQKYPMFVSLLLNEHIRQAELIRIANIFNSSFKFAQNTYSIPITENGTIQNILLNWLIL